MDLVIFRWRGFLPASFVTCLLARTLASRLSHCTMLQARGFRGGCVTVLKLAEQEITKDIQTFESLPLMPQRSLPGGQYLCWEHGATI